VNREYYSTKAQISICVCGSVHSKHGLQAWRWVQYCVRHKCQPTAISTGTACRGAKNQGV